MANLIVRPGSGTGSNWRNIANIYDINDTTTGTVSISSSNYSSRTLTLNFSAMNIPSNAVISKATLTVVTAQSSSTNNTRITVQVDVNGDSNNRVINTQLANNNKTPLTADITNYIDNLSSLKITGNMQGASGYQTFSIYDVNIDVEYEIYDTKVAEYKFSNVNTLETVPFFNDGFKYITEDVISGTTVTRTIYSNELPTSVMFGDEGDYPTIRTESLIEVDYLNISNLDTMYCMFANCSELVFVNTDGWDTSNITDMRYLFWKCYALKNLNLTNWNTNKITNMIELFKNCKSLKSLDLSNWDVSNVTVMSDMFTGCHSLKELKGLNKWNTSNVTNMYEMFWECCSLTELDLSGWNTSKVTEMSWLFCDCYNLKTINLSKWDLTNNNIHNMFASYTYSNPFTLNTVIMNNSNYTSVNKVIEVLPTRTADSYGLLDVAGINDFSQVNVTAAEAKFWDVEDRFKVAEYKFDNEVYDLIPEFNEGYQYTYEDVVNGTETTRTIYSYSLPTEMCFGYRNDGGYTDHGNQDAAHSLLEVMHLRVDNLASMFDLFRDCTAVTSINTKGWNINATSLSCTFEYCESLTSLDVSDWDVSSVTKTVWTFASCHSLKELNLANWDISNVSSMDAMFAYCDSMITIDISNWDFASITSAADILTECTVRKIICDNMTDGNLYTLYNVIPTADFNEFHTIHANNMSTTREQQFDSKYWYKYTDKTLVYYVYDNTIAGTYYPGATNITEDEYTVTTASSGNLTRVRIDSDTGRPTSTKFGADCNPYLNTASNAHKALLAVAHVKTDYMTDMYCMFDGCTNLAQLDTYGWNTSNVTNMCAMFWECSSLTSLDVAHFDVSNVEDISWIFGYCSGLTELDLSNWNTNSATTMAGMFSACTNLVTVDTTNWNTSSVTNMAHMFGREGAGGTYPGCEVLEKVIGIEDWNVGNVKNMYCMFYGAYKLEALDLSKWDTSNVEDMHIMFCAAGYDNPNFSLNIKDWDVSKVENMTYMFDCCASLKELDLSGWDISNVLNMAWMFGNDDYDDSMMLTKLNLSGWKFNSEVDMSNFFAYTNKVNEVIMNDSNYTSINRVIEHLPQRSADSYGLLIVTNVDNYSRVNEAAASTKYWNIWESKIKVTEYKFNNTLADLIPEFNEGFDYVYEDVVEENITTRTVYSNELPTLMRFGRLYDSALDDATNRESSLLEVISMDTTNITNMNCMFQYCRNLTKVNCDWNTSKVVNMSDMFRRCYNISELDVSNWNTENVTTMHAMFANCQNLTYLNTTNWNTAKVTDMNCMFDGCSKLSTIDGVSNWNTGEVLDMYALFRYCSSLQSLDLNNWNTAKVTITANMFRECTGLTQLNINNWTVNSVQYMYGMFYNCSSLTGLNLNNWNTASVTDINCMFYGCTSLIELNVSNFNTNNVTNMSYLFSNCINLTTSIADPSLYIGSIVDLSRWNTSNVTDMSYMFYNCNSITNLDISTWNMTKVTVTEGMITACFALNEVLVNDSDYNTVNKIITELPTRTATEPGMIDVIGVDNASLVEKATAESKNWSVKLYRDKVVEYKFDNTLYDLFPTFNEGYSYDYEDVVEGNVTTRTIYGEAPTMIRFGDHYGAGYTGNPKTLSLLEVLYLNTDNLTNILGLFGYCENLTTVRGIEDWNVSKITNFCDAFVYCGIRGTLDLSRWDVSSMTQNTYLFMSMPHVEEINISNWQIQHKTKFRHLFQGNKARRINMTNISSSSIYDYYYMFNGSKAEEIIGIEDLDVSNAENMCGMFRECNSLTTLDLSNWDTSNVTDMSLMFSNCNNLTSLDVSNWDTSNVYDMSYMFCSDDGSSSLTNIYGIENFDTSNVKNMYAMFHGCGVLQSLDVSHFDTNNVTNMNRMFYNCESLTTLDVSNWDTSEVTDMSYMFTNCSSLTSLEVSGFDTTNVTDMSNMFLGCNLLTSLDVSNWNTENVIDIYRMFYECHSLSLLDVSNWNTSSMTNIDSTFTNCYQLSTIDVSNWNTSNVIYAGCIFGCCFNLTKLDLSKWNTDLMINANYMFAECYNLIKLDLSNWNLNSLEQSLGMMGLCNNLTEVIMNNSDYNSVNKVIAELPTNTADAKGTLNITNDLSQINVATAESKYWNIVQSEQYKIAEYKFTNSSDVLPIFNRGFGYTIEDIVDGTTTTRTIKSTDFPTAISFEETAQLLEVYYLETSNMTSAYNLFYNCSGLTYVDLSHSDFSNIETIERMFTSCTNLVTIDGLNDLDISKVHNMGGIFSDCRKLKEINVSNWDVSKVTNFGAAFRRCYEITSIDLTKWNTSSAILISGMFTSCTKLTSIDLSSWNMTNVTTVNQMFYGCNKLTSVNLYTHLNEGVDTLYLFGNCSALNNVEIYNADYNTVNMVISVLPTKTSAAPGTLRIGGVDDISQVNISAAESKYWNVLQQYKIAEYKFNAYIYENLIPEFNVELTTSDYIISDNADERVIDGIVWESGALIDSTGGEYDNSTCRRTAEFIQVQPNMKYKFSTWGHGFWYDANKNMIGEKVFINNADNEDLIVATSPTNAKYFRMYRSTTDAIELTISTKVVNRTIYSNELPTLMRFGHTWVDEETDEAKANRAASLISISYLNTDNLTSASGMFRQCVNLIAINYNFNTSNVDDMPAMFQHCNNLTTLDASNWDISKVANMGYVFQDCRSLTSLDVSNWDTSNATNMYAMFNNCQSLTILDVSNFITSKVTDMGYMFANCKLLTSLDVNNWDTGNVTNMVNMFDLCSRLVSLNLSNWNVSKVQNMGAMFGTCSSLKELNVSNWKTDSLTKADWMFNKCLNLQELDLSSWNVNNVNNMSYALSDCESLKQLNLSNWNLNNANITGIFSAYSYSGCYNLNNIIINKSNFNSVNKVIAELPERTVDNKGTLDIRGVDGLDQVDIATAQSKYWIIYNRHNDIISISLGNSRIDSVFAESGKKIKNIYLGDNKII